MKYFTCCFLMLMLFLGCAQSNSLRKGVLLNQTNIEQIVERLEIMIFFNGSYSEDKIFEFENVRGIIQNRTFYDVNGCAEYFEKGGSEGFIKYALTDKDGYLKFEEEMKEYHIELKKDENIIIDKHNTADTIRAFVACEESKIMINFDDYSLLKGSKKEISHKRVTVYHYK